MLISILLAALIVLNKTYKGSGCWWYCAKPRFSHFEVGGDALLVELRVIHMDLDICHNKR